MKSGTVGGTPHAPAPNVAAKEPRSTSFRWLEERTASTRLRSQRHRPVMRWPKKKSSANSVHWPAAHVTPTRVGEKPFRPTAAASTSVDAGSQKKIGPEKATANNVATSPQALPVSVASALALAMEVAAVASTYIRCVCVCALVVEVPLLRRRRHRPPCVA